jgi:hypothetical protein
MKLWKWVGDCGRMGDLTGLFVATEEQVAALAGRNVYFGEALGKHSDIDFRFDERDMPKSIDVPAESIEILTKELGTTWSGFNPVEMLAEQDAERGSGIDV